MEQSLQVPRQIQSLLGGAKYQLDTIGCSDLGRSGVGDKWQDIALCIRSMAHNFGTDLFTALLFEHLGFPMNEELVRYYILLDELF